MAKKVNSLQHNIILDWLKLEIICRQEIKHDKKNKRAMMALYRSTGWYVKSIHTKHYITWELV